MRKISIPLFLLSLNLLAVEPSAFKMLPPGAVKPERWLRHQLELQAKGLTGNAEKLYDDIGQSTWLTHKKSSDPQYDWERGPYYARGLLLLAYELDDELLKCFFCAFKFIYKLHCYTW